MIAIFSKAWVRLVHCSLFLWSLALSGCSVAIFITQSPEQPGTSALKSGKEQVCFCFSASDPGQLEVSVWLVPRPPG